LWSELSFSLLAKPHRVNDSERAQRVEASP
jgi:hypothetical protein